MEVTGMFVVQSVVSILVGATLITFVIGIYYGFLVPCWRVWWDEKEIRQIHHRTRSFTWFHSLHVGRGNQQALSLTGEPLVFWSDAWFAIVAKNKGLIVGVLGFHLDNDRLVVRQMQGFPGTNLRGLPLSDFLLASAEEVALVLGKRSVTVVSAHLTDYYDLGEGHPLYPRLYWHQDRLRKIYDQTPKSHGYIFNQVRSEWNKEFVPAAE